MSRLPGVALAARSLTRAFIRHRFRAFAALTAGVLCIALTTSVRVVAVSVEGAIKAAPLSSVVNAEWTVQARSSSGLSLNLIKAMLSAAPEAHLAPVLLANTRIGVRGGAPLVIAGVGPTINQFLSPRDRAALHGYTPASKTVVLNRSWARKQHLRIGSPFPFDTPSGRVVWRVGALIPEASANGGAIAVAYIDAVARVFDREGVADAVLASAPGSARQLKAQLARATRGAASVIRPGEASASYENAFAPTRNLLNILVGIVVLSAGAILFFCWRLTLEDAREQLARLRLCGAKISDLAMAGAFVMGVLFVLSVAIGGPLGVLLGASLSGFARTLVTLTQLAGTPGVPIAGPLLQAIAASLAIFAVALGTSLLNIRRMPVIEAVVGRREVRRASTMSWRRSLAVIVGASALGVLALTLLPRAAGELAFAPLLALLITLSLTVPTLLGSALRRLPGFVALGAGREIAFDARRTATLLCVFSLAIALAIALQGSASSLRNAISRGVAAWTRGDVFVQTAQSGSNLQDDKLASALLPRLAQIRGVASVGYFTYSTLELHSTRVQVWTWGPVNSVRYANMAATAGPSGAALWRSLEGQTVAVSSNYARLHGTMIGDHITLPAVSGSRSLRVVAIINDLTSPSGMLVVSPSQYLALTSDHRVYQAIVTLAPNASAAQVIGRIHTELAGSYPELTVYTRPQIRARFNLLTGQLVEAFIIFGRIMFLLALLIGGATLATSLAVRQRGLALARLVGVPLLLLRRQLRLEALVLGFSAWAIAMPMSVGLIYTLIDSFDAQSGLLPRVELPLLLLAVSLPLAIVMSALSLLAASPRQHIANTLTALAEE